MVFMSRSMRDSKGKPSKPDFLTWLINVKPFERLRSFIRFCGYIMIGFTSFMCAFMFGIFPQTIVVSSTDPITLVETSETFSSTPILTWYMLGVFMYCTIDYYREYRKVVY